MNTTLKILAPLAVVFALLVATNVIYAAWDKPSVAPPGDNVDAPINVGNTEQTRTGDLNLGGTTIDGNFVANKAATFFKTIVFPFANTSDSNAVSSYILTANDGAGNFNSYINTLGGIAATAITNGFALRQTYNPGDGVMRFYSTAARIATGGAIDWTGANIFSIFPDGRIGAHQYCDVDGNNCVDLTGGTGPDVNGFTLYLINAQTSGDVRTAHSVCQAKGYDGVWSFNDTPATEEVYCFVSNIPVTVAPSYSWYLKGATPVGPVGTCGSGFYGTPPHQVVRRYVCIESSVGTNAEVAPGLCSQPKPYDITYVTGSCNGEGGG